MLPHYLLFAALPVHLRHRRVTPLLGASATVLFLASLSMADQEVDKLLASDRGQGDQFGFAVAVSGDTAIVGARLDDDDGASSGSAYVFRFDGGDWVEEDKLTASDAATLDEFGGAVAIGGDTAAVGARLDADDGSNSGAVYVFRNTGTTWIEEAKLTASDASAEAMFGSSIAISGSTLVVGASGDSSAQGAAYVFRFNGTTWVEEEKLRASDGAAGDQFGVVSVSGDTAVVGALLEANQRGAAYVFRFNGTNWVEEDKLTASDGVAGDQFGAVSVSGDAALVGARQDDDDGVNSGAAYVFRFDGMTWLEETKLTARDAAASDNFGGSVSISGDALVVGAVLDDDGASNSGSAYVFRYNGVSWMEQAKLLASDAAANDGLGIQVSLDGETAVVGARFDDGRGSAYVFSVPEPSAASLTGAALAALAGLARRARDRGRPGRATARHQPC